MKLLSSLVACAAFFFILSAPALAEDKHSYELVKLDFNVKNSPSDDWTVYSIYLNTDEISSEKSRTPGTAKLSAEYWTADSRSLGDGAIAVSVTLPRSALDSKEIIILGGTDTSHDESLINLCGDRLNIPNPSSNLKIKQDGSGALDGGDLFSNAEDCFSVSIVERLRHDTVNGSFNVFTTPQPDHVTFGERERSINRSLRRIGVDPSPLDCISIGLCEVDMGGGQISGGGRCYLNRLIFTLLRNHGSTGTYGITGVCECAGPTHLTD